MVHTHTQHTHTTDKTNNTITTTTTNPKHIADAFQWLLPDPLHILDRKWSCLFYQNQLCVFSLPSPLHFFFGSCLAYLPFVFPSYVIYFFKNLFFFMGINWICLFSKIIILFFFGRILYIFSLINKVEFFMIEIFYLIKNLFFLTAWQGINLGQIRDDLLLHAFESITLKVWVRQISTLGFKGERVYKRRNQRWSRDIPQNPGIGWQS